MTDDKGANVDETTETTEHPTVMEVTWFRREPTGGTANVKRDEPVNGTVWVKAEVDGGETSDGA